MATLSQDQPQRPGGSEHTRARAAAIRWASEIITRQDVVYLDTETTGLSGDAEIVEIAVVDGRGRTLLDTLVKPDGVIPVEVARIHGIDDRMVASAPKWAQIYPILLDIIQHHCVVVYNAAFDLRLVNQMNRRNGYPPQPNSWHCAMQHYAAFSGEWNYRYGSYRWHMLGSALRNFGHAASYHRALSDAIGCRLVVQGMADN